MPQRMITWRVPKKWYQFICGKICVRRGFRIVTGTTSIFQEPLLTGESIHTHTCHTGESTIVRCNTMCMIGNNNNAKITLMLKYLDSDITLMPRLPWSQDYDDADITF
jgi:hypothetical protein